MEGGEKTYGVEEGVVEEEDFMHETLAELSSRLQVFRLTFLYVSVFPQVSWFGAVLVLC